MFLLLNKVLWLATSPSFYFGVNRVSRQRSPKVVFLFWAYAWHVFVCSALFISKYFHLIPLYICILCVRFRRLMKKKYYPIRLCNIFLPVVSPSSSPSISSNCFLKKSLFCLLFFVKAWELLLESLRDQWIDSILTIHCRQCN